MPSKEKIFQIFKYSIYVLLTANMYFFLEEEVLAYPIRYPNGIEFHQIYEGFAASIDTAAWLILLWLLELETYILEDEIITKSIKYTLFLIKSICYGFIVYSFFGYYANLVIFNEAESYLQATNLCQLASGDWAYSVDINEYQAITLNNCEQLSASNEFFKFPGMQAIVDLNGLIEIIRLGWIDVINSGVWIIVVLIIEINIVLVEKNNYISVSKKLSFLSKYFLYPILFFNAIYWGMKGDFIDFWDAFLWLVAFLFIELNIIQWDQDRNIKKQ